MTRSLIMKGAHMKAIKRGIDLSKHNKVYDWEKVSKAVDFVILRAGGDYNKKYKDSKFEYYYNACKMYNIPVGAYYDCGKEFYTSDKGIECARHFHDLLSGKQLEYPVYMDIEVTPAKYRKLITDAAVSFCEYMQDRRYFIGIYASDISGFQDLLQFDRVKAYSQWVARYGNKPSYVKTYGMWQYTSTGRISGIEGNVDQDISYFDFPEVIKGVHLNGY